jgi:oxygen-dependent protoporphyrinogen oxidase
MGKHAVVVGGGISGLTAARRLSLEKKCRVTVLEASRRFGGVIRTFRDGPLRMEAGADAFDGREPAVLDLCGELGLQNDLLECVPTLRNISFSRKGKITSVPLSSPSALLGSPLLSLRTRARLLIEPWVPARKDPSDESIAGFTRRRFGAGLLEELAGPLVRGVLMAEPEKLSLREYFPDLQEMENGHGSIGKAILRGRAKIAGKASFFNRWQGAKLRGHFTLHGGLDRLTGALEQRPGDARLELGAEVVSVKREKRWDVLLADGRRIQADAVCLAMPAQGAARVLREFAPLLAGELSRVRYDPVAAVNMVFPKKELPKAFPASGFLVPAVGCSWPIASLKSIGETGDGGSFRLRAFISGVLQPGLFSQNDEGIREKVVRFLADEWDIKTQPLWTVVERYPASLAQYETGHGQTVRGIEALLPRYPGLFLAGNGYHGFGISDCVREAVNAALGMSAWLDALGA